MFTATFTTACLCLAVLKLAAEKHVAMLFAPVRSLFILTHTYCIHSPPLFTLTQDGIYKPPPIQWSRDDYFDFPKVHINDCIPAIPPFPTQKTINMQERNLGCNTKPSEW